MADFVTLTCPSCGGRLQITDDMDRFACAYCGAEHIVQRRGGIVSIAPIVERLDKVQEYTGRAASELAMMRLQNEINSLEAQKQRLPKKASYGAGLGLVSLGILLFLWGLRTADEGGRRFGLLMAVLFVGIGLLKCWGQARSNKRWSDTARQIERELARKREELGKHQRIVSG